MKYKIEQIIRYHNGMVLKIGDKIKVTRFHELFDIQNDDDSFPFTTYEVQIISISKRIGLRRIIDGSNFDIQMSLEEFEEVFYVKL